MNRIKNQVFYQNQSIQGQENGGFKNTVVFQSNQILDQRYQILQPIGKGGFGLVYLAYDLHMEIYVVIKQVEAQRGVLPSRHEVDTLKLLKQQNLPRVYDCITVDNYLYTVMDYVEGEDLDHKLQRGVVFSVEDLIRWFRQLTDVLAYLEKKHVVHSDIKPANIIITPENEAMLIDFNISVNRTNSRAVGYSGPYASPEQMNGMRLDTRSDIYSLAATFYELISHKKASPLYYVRPLRELKVNVSDTFCEIIDTAMQKDPELRFQTAVDMKRRLNNMWKSRKYYRIYLLLQVLILSLSTICLSFGAYFMIHGSREKTRIAYVTAYNTAISEINNKEYITAGMACNDILNRYESLLNKNPDQKAEILKGLGDVYRSQQSYEAARTFYQQAAGLLTSRNDPLAVDCYNAMAQTYLEEEEVNMAEYILTKAETEGVEGTALTLLRIQIASMEGRETACLQEAQALLTTGGNPAILSRACIAAAQCASDVEVQIEWYEKAMPYTTEQKLYREIGIGLAEISTSYQDAELVKRAMDDATSCYQWLTARSDASVNDFINLAAITRLNGDYDTSLEALERLEISKILNVDIGVVYLQKAFTYDMRGDSVKTKEMLRLTVNNVRQETVSDADWQHLQQLRNRYGI